MKLFLLILFSALSLSAQTMETERWGKAEISYATVTKKAGHNNASSGIMNIAVPAYRILISDVDGDNCPFEPTCSSFFAESVKETNFAQGTLMFFDRFTRDMNFINREGKYYHIPGHRYFDPPENYILGNTEMKLYYSGWLN